LANGGRQRLAEQRKRASGGSEVDGLAVEGVARGARRRRREIRRSMPILEGHGLAAGTIAKRVVTDLRTRIRVKDVDRRVRVAERVGDSGQRRRDSAAACAEDDVR
jgi:hypothetical protein